MPDKYTYKPGKKKKSAARRPTDVQTGSAVVPATAPEQKNDDVQPATMSVSSLSSQSGTAAKVGTSQPEGRGISRVSNLGAELRRLAIIATFVIIVLVAAAMVLK